MERTEPALAPEWLRYTGHLAGGGPSFHHSEISSPVRPTSRPFSGSNEIDVPQYVGRRLTSNFSHSSSKNCSSKNPYGSFSRSHHDKARKKFRPKDLWDLDFSDSLTALTNQVERGDLRCSQTLVLRKPGKQLPQRVEDVQHRGNGMVLPDSNFGTNRKAVFEKDFTSLVAEEKQGVTGIRRVLSPSLSSAVQSLSIGSCGEKWTSVLAEVPAIRANNVMANSPIQPSVFTASNSSSGISTTGGLNMAEALSQPVARDCTTTELPDKSQRLEEMAIKQSRQLIPMTPSMVKPLVSSSMDKSKQPKIAVRTKEMLAPSRGVQLLPHSTHIASQSRAVQSRSESTCPSHVGKFLVLKPGRENINPGAKDASNSTGDANGSVANGQLAMASPLPITCTSQSNSIVSVVEVDALSVSSKFTLSKRSSQSLAQSRSEFFNLMRRKNSSCAATFESDSISAVSSSTSQTYGENFKGSHAAPICVMENGDQIVCNGGGDNSSTYVTMFSNTGDSKMSGNGSIYPDEEEAAFLRSLGWEENGGDDEGLTEEEINAFYQEYMNKRPSLEVSQLPIEMFDTT